jgi:hypothetical protein
MAYNKLVESISTAIENKLKEISARYNFDLGEEFEIAICELLATILPEKYGICRGFIVAQDDSFAGDDIIIYDRNGFPTLRLFERQKYDKKQEIPIEAVYAYIEAKHTLHLIDEKSGQGLYKACQQIGAIKNLKRERRALTAIDPYINIGEGFHVNRPNWPQYTNPLYCAILSRFVRNDTKGEELKPEEVFNSLKKAVFPANVLRPDLIVLGPKNIIFPTRTIGPKQMLFESPFNVEGVNGPTHRTTNCSALALGIIIMLYALDIIKLDKMPYVEIIKEQLR